MTFARAVTGFIAALVAFVALAPSPASANVVLQADLVCANVTFSPFSVIQSNPATYGVATLEVLNGNSPNPLLKATFKGFGLPPGYTPKCAVLCVVDGILDLFDFAAFDPCGPPDLLVAPNGTFISKQTIPLGQSFTPPFEGGCLLSVPAFLVQFGGSGAVVCAPGFGSFISFP